MVTQATPDIQTTLMTMLEAMQAKLVKNMQSKLEENSKNMQARLEVKFEDSNKTM